jgi:hypothetical protein
MTFWTKFYLKMSMPLIVSILVIGISFVQHKRSKDQNLQPLFFKSFLFEKLISLVILFVVAMYTFLVSSSLSPFKCSYFNGKYTMFESPSEQCFDEIWFRNFAAVVIFSLLYTFGLPGLLLFLFRKHKDSLEAPAFQAVFQGLVSPYRLKFIWWEIVSVSKRTLFVVLCSFLSMSEGASGLIFCAFVVIGFFLFLEVLFKPYKRHSDLVTSTS